MQPPRVEIIMSNSIASGIEFANFALSVFDLKCQETCFSYLKWDLGSFVVVQ